MEICKINKKIIQWKIIDNTRPATIKYSMAPKRPNELLCEIKKVKVQGEAWTIFVALLNNLPYEIFGGLSKYVDIQNKYKFGKIIKNGKIEGITTYNLIVGEDEDQMTIKDIANVFDNPNFGAFTRILSLSLRHGVPIQYVVEQLQKDKHSDITSFSKVMARVLKSYIKDGTKASDACPSCGDSGGLKYQEGCLSCSLCNFSKCG
jgi:ribonucleoside-diphosphate reductase alpha chain